MEPTYSFPPNDETIERLRDISYVIANALVLEGVVPTQTLIEEDVPGYAYDLAVRLGFWPKPAANPPGAQTIMLGTYDVSQGEREYFIGLLDVLSGLYEDLQLVDGGLKRTPLMIYKQKKKELHMTWDTFRQWLGVNEITMKRLKDPNYRKTKRETLENVAKKLRCTWLELKWPENTEKEE